MDKFKLCSEASILVGGNRVLGFNNASTEEQVAGELYDSVIDSLIGGYRWRCFTTQFQLSRREAPPLARYSAAYLIPPKTALLNAVTVNDALIEFDRYDDLILCDAEATDEVIADITRRTDEAHWPPYFTNCARLLLASMFAVPIAEDVNKAAAYEQKFRVAYSQARSVDSQGRTARKLPVGGFARIHGGRP